MLLFFPFWPFTLLFFSRLWPCTLLFFSLFWPCTLLFYPLATYLSVVFSLFGHTMLWFSYLAVAISSCHTLCYCYHLWQLIFPLFFNSRYALGCYFDTLLLFSPWFCLPDLVLCQSRCCQTGCDVAFCGHNTTNLTSCVSE